MPSTNPFIDPPRLSAPTKYHHRFSHSRSDSRSPARQHARDYDPLLRDLSPSATLRAFVTDPSESNASDALAASIRSSSMGERALGAKAAQACLDLRSWTREVEAWEWPGTFDVPEPTRNKVRLSTMTFNSVFSGDTIDSVDDEEGGGGKDYWGSLPAKTVQAHEHRADEIGQKLDEMDVEELKEYVLATHYRVASRPQSRDDSIGTLSTTTDLKQLDDFTALVTATILQALPYLSRLNRLLDTWTMRLIILRNAPKYLQDLKRARTDLDHGWAAIAVSSTSGSNMAHARFDRKTMLDMKAMIERQVGSLGRRLDRFLDDLEGRDDTVPDAWIDDFELLEKAYGSWVVQAERKVLENEWREGGVGIQSPASHPRDRVMYESGNSAVASELEVPELDHDAVMRPSMDQTKEETSHTQSEGQGAGLSKSTIPSAGNTIAELSTTRLLDRPIPTLVADNNGRSNELHDSVITSSQPSREGTPSPNPSNQEGQSQVAKRRAAFLGEIERTNSLKQSKSPPVVRPFEHASNAFTRLFKKDRSPEQVKTKRSVSSKLSAFSSSDDVSSSGGDRKPVNPVSNASSRFNTVATEGVSHPPSGSVRDAGKSTATASSSTPSKAKSEEHQIQDNANNVSPLSARRAQEVESLNIKSQKGATLQARRSTGLSSPFHSPGLQSPEDWPLPSPVKPQTETYSPSKPSKLSSESLKDGRGSDDELHTPTAPIQSDMFDQMFIESLPNTSDESDMRPKSARAHSRSTSWGLFRKRASSLPRSNRHAAADTHRPSIPKDYLDMISSYQSKNPTASALPASHDHQSDSSYTHEYPRGERIIPYASHVQGVDDEQSTLASKFTGANLYASNYSAWEQATSRSSNSLPLESRGSYGTATDDGDDDNRPTRPSAIKRASVTSIELFSRAQLKSIDVPKSRPNSISSKITPPQTPQQTPGSSEILPAGDADALNSAAVSSKDLAAFPTPPRHSSLPGDANFTPGQTSPALRTALPEHGQQQESPIGASASPGDAPLNVAMKKRRAKSGLRNENQSPSSSKPTASPSKRIVHDVEEDNFDRHVSEVLETLPTDIRFKVRAGAETPAPRAGYSAPRPKQPHSRKTSRDHSMIIAPAEHSPKKSSLMSDPEVKLYHLTQPGRDEPIKLFVRLVGEGERVMVRVGGGWADLADYLRQYAEHHGSRTVSEGGVEVQTMPNALTRKVSGPAESRAKTPVTPRPDSSDSDKDWPIRPTTNLRPGNGRTTPASERGRQTPTATTPQSSSNSSRPSTANVSRPPSRQAASEVGLGGPSSGKKNGLSEHKAKWVEGMIERAKQASAEKTREDNQKYFGELGKAGGTRRVIFRSTSGAAPGDKTK